MAHGEREIADARVSAATVSAAGTVADAASASDERYYLASQWQLMWSKFRRHRLAIIGAGVLGLFYLGALFCEFLSPYVPLQRNADFIFAPPQRIHFHDGSRFHLRPFVYEFRQVLNEETYRWEYNRDPNTRYPVRLFHRGDEYRFWRLFRTDLHLFGVDAPGTIYLLGTDELGRDLLTRVLYASRISLSVGLGGVLISFLLGCLLGGISGFYSGKVDTIIQRVIEFLRSIPTIPLWMGLAAALPAHWSAIKVYFGITLVLSIVGWTGLARVVRGKLLELRGEDFVTAARVAGAPEHRIITRHLLPSFSSYLIVNITLDIPGMILGETALSFLGLGLRPPVVSWGVLLKAAQNVRTVAQQPWLLMPALFVIVAVLAFNFLGDGLRDAADPYK